MNRRRFFTLLGSAAAWPLAARAQQPAALPTIGLLYAGTPDAWGRAGLFKGLSEIGYIEGRNLKVEERSANNEPARLTELAADLVSRKVSVIVTLGGPAAALAAKAATATIPIVFETGSDPVERGLVPSVNRPGGTMTGVSILSPLLGAKRLQLLHELLPSAALFGVLINPSGPIVEHMIKDSRMAASALGVQVDFVYARNSREIEIAFANLVQKRVDGLVISTSPLFGGAQRAQLATLAARHALPAISHDRRNA